MNVAILPARGGSRRIPGKNIRLFHGKPIIQHSIDAAKASGLFDRIYISTDDRATMRIAVRNGCYVHIRSNEYLCGPVAGTQEVARDCIVNTCGTRYEYACVIYATAPLMLPADLMGGFKKLGLQGNRFVYSVGPDGVDAGQWYWGAATAFWKSLPLEGNSWHYPLPAERVQDINTESDWLRAEQMYAELHKVAA